MARSVVTASYYRAIALMLVALFCGSDAYAGNYAPNALVGLNGIEVLIEDLSRDALKAGLSQERLATIVALRLRRAGIPVLTPPTDQQGSPYLYVRVSALRIKESVLLVYTVEVSLRQNVWLERASPLGTGSPAWVAAASTGADSTMGYAGEGVFVGSVIESVEEFIDNFALAYLTSKEMEKSKEKPFDPEEFLRSTAPAAEKPEEKPAKWTPKGSRPVSPVSDRKINSTRVPQERTPDIAKPAPQ